MPLNYSCLAASSTLATNKKGPAAGRRQPLCLVCAGDPLPGLCPQLHRPPDPRHLGRGHQARPQSDRCRYRLPVRHGVRRFLRAVRHPARAAGRQLASRAIDEHRASALVGDDRPVRLRAVGPHPVGRAHRRRDRRGDRQPGRLFADFRLVPAAAASDGARHLFVGHLYRRRPVAVHRRADRRAMGPGLSRS